MKRKELLKLVEDNLVRSYGETLRDYGTAKVMAQRLVSQLIRRKVIKIKK